VPQQPAVDLKTLLEKLLRKHPDAQASA